MQVGHHLMNGLVILHGLTTAAASTVFQLQIKVVLVKWFNSSCAGERRKSSVVHTLVESSSLTASSLFSCGEAATRKPLPPQFSSIPSSVSPRVWANVEFVNCFDIISKVKVLVLVSEVVKKSLSQFRLVYGS